MNNGAIIVLGMRQFYEIIHHRQTCRCSECRLSLNRYIRIFLFIFLGQNVERKKSIGTESSCALRIDKQTENIV